MNSPEEFIPYNESAIGRCSLCGGPVTIPSVWGGVIPPVPTCRRCGATAAPPPEPQLPVIPMIPAQTRTIEVISTDPNQVHFGTGISSPKQPQ